MASLASLLEDFRNYRGVQDWNLGRQEDQMLGHSEQARGLWRLLQGLGVGDVAGIGAIKAYHGSPQLFDKFDMSKLDTKGSVQSQGRGLYFAEGLNDAMHYKPPESGAIYETSLEWPDVARESSDPLSPHHFLNWDNPLGQQSDFIKATLGITDKPYERGVFAKYKQSILDKYGGTLKKMTPDEVSEYKRLFSQAEHPLGVHGAYPAQEGSTFYGRLKSQNNLGSEVNASEFLRALGIPGIQYGGKSKNYVVFDDQIPRIVARNGVPVRGLKGIVGQ